MLGIWIKALVFIITLLTIWLDNICIHSQTIDPSIVTLDAIAKSTCDTDLNEGLTMVYEPDGIR